MLEGYADPVDALSGKYEILRDDLLDILFASLEGAVEMVFGRSIEQLEEGPHGVAVTFSDGSRRDYPYSRPISKKGR